MREQAQKNDESQKKPLKTPEFNDAKQQKRGSKGKNAHNCRSDGEETHSNTTKQNKKLTKRRKSRKRTASLKVILSPYETGILLSDSQGQSCAYAISVAFHCIPPMIYHIFEVHLFFGTFSCGFGEVLVCFGAITAPNSGCLLLSSPTANPTFRGPFLALCWLSAPLTTTNALITLSSFI